MKDYFAALLPDGVTGVTRCNSQVKSNKPAVLNEQRYVTPMKYIRCNGGNQFYESLHPVTYSEMDKVTEEARKGALLHQQHLVTPRSEDLSYFYHERAAIMEFDGRLNRTEAERLAYQEALNTLLTEECPEILVQLESIIYQPFLNSRS